MLSDIVNSQKYLFSDGVQTVLRGQENRARVVIMLNGNLVQNERSSSKGLNARVYKNGVYGFSSSAEYTEESAREVLRCATNNAQFLDGKVKPCKPVLSSVASGIYPSDNGITDTEQKKLVDAVKYLDDFIVRTYKNLVSRTIVYSEYSQDKIICTSDAFSGHVTNSRVQVNVCLSMMSDSGSPVEIFDSWGGGGCFDDYFSSVDWVFPKIDKLYSQLEAKSHGIYAEAGIKTVILGGEMAGMLAHEAVGHTVEADLVLGGSTAGPNLKKQVASELINLTDFAHTAFGETTKLPVYIDDEGVKAEDSVLIKNGILTGYMHNRESASHFGVMPKGNARGWSFNDEPLIRMRNTAVLPGTSNLEDMIKSVDDGYYLIKSGNGQADLTGEFMFGVTMGYEIKNGKIGRALLDTTVSGIAFEMLKTADMVSNNMNWSLGVCGKKQPMTVSMGGPEIRCKIMIGGR